MVPIFRNFLHVLKRSKGASILNMAGLSVAFAVFLAILIQVNYEYSYDASFPKSDHIYRLQLQKEEAEQESSSLIPRPLFDIVRAEIPELSNSCLIGKPFRLVAFTVVNAEGDFSFFEEGPAYADTNVVKVFDLEVMAGDYKKALTAPDHVFLPWSLAQKFFGGINAVGKTLLLNGTREMTVAAIYRDVPSNSTFQNHIYSVSFASGTEWYQWNYESYYVIPEGTDFAGLVTKLQGVDQVLASNSSQEQVFSSSRIEFCPLKDIYFADIRHWREPSGNRMLTHVLLLIGVIVLIVSVVNFVNFSIALAPSRMKGLNTRKTFGATNLSLRVCVVSEAIIFAFLAFVVGAFFCYLLSCTFVQEIVSASLNPMEHPELVVGLAGVSLLIGLLAGLYPAFYMTSFSPALMLKGSQALSPRGIFLRNTLVVFQYTVSVVLIIGILFIGRQVNMMKNRPWGIEKEHVVYLKNNRDIRQNRDAFINELRQHPAISDVTFASELIGDIGMQHWFFGAMVDGKEMELQADACVIAANFLQFFGIQVAEGDRFVSTQDSLAMVNETFGQTYHYDPMGKEVAGVKVGRILKDFNLLPMQQKIRPLILLVDEEWGDNYFYVKINEAARADALSHIRHILRDFSPAYRGEVRFLDDYLNGLYQTEERVGFLVNIFGLATILISLMGIYGLILFNARYKAKEIGIRKVNGATNWQMVVFVNRNFAWMVLLAFAIACPLAWYAVSIWLTGFAYRISLSPGIFVLGGVIIAALTLLTISWQSWKAANQNPVKVLKTE